LSGASLNFSNKTKINNFSFFSVTPFILRVVTDSSSVSEKVLKKYFGFDSFREGQREIVDSIISDHDTLAIRSTGSGKSICFQVPALYFPHLTLVISPLISLMSDQVQALVNKNISAAFINSSLPKLEIEKRVQQLKEEKIKLLYLSPEKLESKNFSQLLTTLKISFIAVDESHCISMWGHDFRPSYTRIPKFICRLNPRPTIAAFTATATPMIADDIVNCLSLHKPKIFKQSSLRTNLQLNIIHCQHRASKQLLLLKILKKHRQHSGIIYCSTRKATEQVAALINNLNFNQQLTRTNVLAYHGGLDSDQRELIQQQFMDGRVKLISATNAFGMGVDKSDVRFVIHYQLSANIENYYQEVGRAGRDGAQSYCYLLFEERDAFIQERMISQTAPERIKIELNKLNTFLEMVYSQSCLQQKLAQYFGDDLEQSCNNCSNCQAPNIMFSEEEKEIWNKLHQHPQLNQVPEQLKILFTLINPQSKQEWLALPGVGEGLLQMLEQANILGTCLNQ